MPKGAYIGVDNIAHKIKKGYIGVDGVARRIRKAYIGVGGVARPCWSGGEVVYCGTPVHIYWGRNNMSADSNKSYAIFAGGTNIDDRNYVDAFDSSLGQVVLNNFRSSPYPSVSHVGDYVIFWEPTYGTAEAYNSSLEQILPPSLPNNVGAGTTAYNKNYALIGSKNDSVYAYNSSLECISAPSFTKIPRSTKYLSGGNVRQYAVFANNDEERLFTDAYDESLNMKTVDVLTATGREGMVAVGVGNYVLFTGGNHYHYISDYRMNTVEGYNSSLELNASIEPLSDVKYRHAATNVDDFAIIAGGDMGGGSPPATSTYVDTYDSSLVKKTATPLNSARYDLSAASIGNYAFFAGGGMYTEPIDVYMVN